MTPETSQKSMSQFDLRPLYYDRLDLGWSEDNIFSCMRPVMVEYLRMLFDRSGIDIDEKVFNALKIVSRELFVPEKAKPYAYNNLPLNNFPQSKNSDKPSTSTISSPEIVARMTHELNVFELLPGIKPDKPLQILEIGSGGYQTAVLHTLLSIIAQERTELRDNFHITSIDINSDIVRLAQSRLEALEYENISTVLVDEKSSLPFADESFNGILVTAAVATEYTWGELTFLHLFGGDTYTFDYHDEVSDLTRSLRPFLDLLVPGGRMVIPIKFADDLTMLFSCTRNYNHSNEDTITLKYITPCTFVPYQTE